MEIIMIIGINIVALIIVYYIFKIISRYFKHYHIMKTKYINENARIRNEYSSITFNMNQIKEFDSKARKHYNEQIEIKKKLQENLNGLFVLNKDYYEDERVFDYCDSKNLNDNFIKYKKEVLDEMYASNSVLYYRIIQYIYSLLIFV